MTNPCYNKHTKADCPDRKPGCAGKCEKWAEYVKLREVKYAERRKAYFSKPDKEACFDEKAKRLLRTRSNPRNHTTKE